MLVMLALAAMLARSLPSDADDAFFAFLLVLRFPFDACEPSAVLPPRALDPEPSALMPCTLVHPKSESAATNQKPLKLDTFLPKP